MINTKNVVGRRDVSYASLEDLLADAKRCTGSAVHRLGNWSPGQIYEHLARSMNASIDGFGMTFPAPLRWVMSLFMKKKMLYKLVPAGFKAPETMRPKEMPDAEGLASLEKSIERQKNETKRVIHPGFGTLTNEEWNAFHLRHAELHMSFLKPQN